MNVFSRHPVDNPGITQPWGANRTGGVIPDPNGTPVQQLVYNYGNYQIYGHDGIDYGCPIGTPVYAPGPGVIEWSGWGQDMPEHIAVKYGFVYGPGGWPSGILVCIDHGGIGSYVAHLSASYYESGRRVNAGTLIGLSGTTGRSGGPHVHFSAIRFPVNYADGLYSRVNPLDYFAIETVVPVAPGASGDTSIKTPVPATPKEWDEMASKEEIRAVVREELRRERTPLVKAIWNHLIWGRTQPDPGKNENNSITMIQELANIRTAQINSQDATKQDVVDAIQDNVVTVEVRGRE